MGWLTIPEYISEPTSVNTTDLVAGGAQSAQTAELVRKLNRATSWIDGQTSQGTLQASQRTETRRVYVGRDGVIPLKPGPFPLITLDSLSVGSTAANLIAVSDLTGYWIEEECFMVPIAGAGVTWTTLTFAAPRVGGQILARYAYTAGHPHTELRATVAPAGTALTVVSTVGMTVGQVLTIVDGASSENVTVTGITSATVVAVTAIANAHTYVAGAATAIAVHAFPEDLKQAATLIASALIKARGNDAIVMSQLLAPAATSGTDPVASADIRMARDIIRSYGRVV